jgi:hypothetical protein
LHKFGGLCCKTAMKRAPQADLDFDAPRWRFSSYAMRSCGEETGALCDAGRTMSLSILLRGIEKAGNVEHHPYFTAAEQRATRHAANTVLPSLRRGSETSLSNAHSPGRGGAHLPARESPAKLGWVARFSDEQLPRYQPREISGPGVNRVYIA